MKEFIYKILSFLFPNSFQIGPVIEEQKSKRNIEYISKNLLTKNEIIFYNKLKKIENFGEYIVLPQINLASIINKDTKYRNELFRNIDFGIFNKEYKPLILIELNDKTHKYKQRRKRDIKVNELCQKANLKLITFYTSYANEENYIINRILNIIKED